MTPRCSGSFRRTTASLVLAGATLLVVACGGTGRPVAPPTGTTAPDQFLFDRAAASMKDKKYLTAREYYTQIFDNYPQSPLRPEAKIGMGDTYLSEGGEANLVLAENEFKEFITFYPTNSHADQAQYKLAMTHFSRMKAAQRDQTETFAAVRE